MVVIKFNLSSIKLLSSPKLVQFTSDRMENMEQCSDFLPSPVPTIAAMKALRDDYQTKNAIFQANRSVLNEQIRDAAYDALIQGHVDWIGYASPIIGDNKELADRFGYPQYATRTKAEVPEGVPPKPRMVLTPNPGEVILMAKPYKQDKKTIFYNWQISDDNGETYTYLPALGNSYRRRITLALGKTFFVRLAYATTAGEGPFSDALEISLTRDMIVKEKKLKKAA